MKNYKTVEEVIFNAARPLNIRIPKDIYLILKKAVTRKYLRYCRKLVQKYNCGNANVVNNEDANADDGRHTQTAFADDGA